VQLGLQNTIPACKIELPPQKGRVSEHALLSTPCGTHNIDEITIADVVHPFAASEHAPYKVFRAVPKKTPPKTGWPILYMLDGNAAFDFLTAQHLAQTPDLVVIGIGQETPAQFDRTARARDLTFPAPDQTALVADDAYGGRLTGGAPQFMDLLTGDLRHAAEQGLDINSAQRSLWGHSIGGLFVLNMLLKAPKSFARFAAISPSMWMHPERFDVVLRSAGPLKTALYLGSGNREKRSFSDGPEPADAPGSFYELRDHFMGLPEMDVSWQIYDGAVHIASLASSLPSVLAFAAAQQA
jgi:predicted alpha/beta superfamily hydrolase